MTIPKVKLFIFPDPTKMKARFLKSEMQQEQPHQLPLWNSKQLDTDTLSKKFQYTYFLPISMHQKSKMNIKIPI